MSKPELPAAAARFATAALGPAASVRTLQSGPGGRATFLWTGARGAGVLKLHVSIRTFRQEVGAYEHWLRRLPDVPRLLGAHEARPHALLLEVLPGSPVSASAFPADVERRLHERAGAWLAELHGVPFEDADDLPLDEAYRRRWTQWIGRAAASGQRAEPPLQWAGERLRDALPWLVDATRVPCHRDFEPRNWLATREGAWIGAIDFEHARPDHPWADVSRLAAYVWPARPDLERAFWKGHGSPPTAADRTTITAFAAVDAAQRWVWATRKGDATLAHGARSALTALGAPEDDLRRPLP